MKPFLAIIVTVGACQTTTPPPVDTGCSRENCVAMTQCRVGLESTTHTCVHANGGILEGFDLFAACVEVCERRDAGALVSCIAGFGAACENASTEQREAYVDGCLATSPPPAAACAGACTNTWKICDSNCPQSAFPECNDCAVQCALSEADCFNSCGN